MSRITTGNFQCWEFAQYIVAEAGMPEKVFNHYEDAAKYFTARVCNKIKNAHTNFVDYALMRNYLQIEDWWIHIDLNEVDTGKPRSVSESITAWIMNNI